MKTINFSEVKPFVRYSRYIDTDMKKFNTSICAYDNRLFYCVSGLGKINIQDKWYDIYSGLLIFIKSGIPYRYAPDNLNPMKFIGVNFDFTYKKSNLDIPIPPERDVSFNSKKLIEDINFSDASLFNSSFVIETTDNVYEKLSEINYEYSHKTTFYLERCSGLLLNILGNAAIFDEHKIANTKNGINDIIKYLNKNYNQKISNKSIGEKFGYHPNYVNQLFIKYTGISLHQYLQNIRIMYAIHMLQNTELSITEICSKTGFNDICHFSKYFKQKTGRIPSSFRF